jgi:hypothetical protein
VTAHPAQPDNLAVDRAEALLRTAANVLQSQANVLHEKPTRRNREALRRVLAGVVADVEAVRYALKD